MIEIRSRWNADKIIYRSESAETLRDVVLESVRAGADLAGANLAGANLAGYCRLVAWARPDLTRTAPTLAEAISVALRAFDDREQLRELAGGAS